MAKLILSMDGLVLKEYTLGKERTTIGRKPHNDIQIDNLAVSGEHAVIVTILNDSFLEDLGSTNGTLVNGQPVKKHFLQNNDVVELGKYKLKYLAEATGPAKAADFEKTMVLRPGAMKAFAPAAAPAHAAPGAPAAAAKPAAAGAVAAGVAAGALAAGAATGTPAAKPTGEAPSAPAPAAAPAPRIGVLQVLTGGNAGKELELVKPLTRLGKPGVQVAVITRRPQGYFITHVEGANFPVLNGKTVDAQAHPLNDHDIIELAGVKMEFFFKT
ncbi:MAG: FHA domain-containing protein [Betaproteobacteria bacterium]|nr:FHA domain-containing protein [Betaproteobacteria bacterium]